MMFIDTNKNNAMTVDLKRKNISTWNNGKIYKLVTWLLSIHLLQLSQTKCFRTIRQSEVIKYRKAFVLFSKKHRRFDLKSLIQKDYAEETKHAEI